MESFNCKLFVSLIAVAAFAIYSNAMPNEASVSVGGAGGGAGPPAPAGAPGATAPPSSNSSNSTDSHFSGDLEEEEETPETIELDKQISALKEKECIVLLGECWLFYKITKSYLPEEQRLKVCLKRTKGFSVCDYLADDQAEQARDEAEGRAKAEEEEKIEKEQKAVERLDKLQKRKEEIAARWISMKEEARLQREGGNGTVGNSTEIPMTSEMPEEEEEEETAEPEAA